MQVNPQVLVANPSIKIGIVASEKNYRKFFNSVVPESKTEPLVKVANYLGGWGFTFPNLMNDPVDDLHHVVIILDEESEQQVKECAIMQSNQQPCTIISLHQTETARLCKVNHACEFTLAGKFEFRDLFDNIVIAIVGRHKLAKLYQ
jgi:hypothetical protein